MAGCTFLGGQEFWNVHQYILWISQKIVFSMFEWISNQQKQWTTVVEKQTFQNKSWLYQKWHIWKLSLPWFKTFRMSGQFWKGTWWSLCSSAQVIAHSGYPRHRETWVHGRKVGGGWQEVITTRVLHNYCLIQLILFQNPETLVFHCLLNHLSPHGHLTCST